MQFLHEEFSNNSEFIDALKLFLQSNSRPQMSEYPDDLERWEVEQIRKRQQRFATETDLSYLERFLYEEFFSVNQTPNLNSPEMMQGMPGMTVGGLVSHFYDETVLNGIPLKDILDLPFFGKQMHEAVASLHASVSTNYNSLVAKFVQRVELLSTRNDTDFRKPRSILPAQRPGNTVLADIYKGDSGYQEKYPELDSIGYRLLALLKAEPTFMELVQDKRLLELVGISENQKISRAAFFVRAWKYFQSLFKPEANKKELLAKMLRIRIYPEMQIFFRYMSPSGIINEWVGQKGLQ